MSVHVLASSSSQSNLAAIFMSQVKHASDSINRESRFLGSKRSKKGFLAPTADGKSPPRVLDSWFLVSALVGVRGDLPSFLIQ
jgi:hypothetical protein